MESVATSEIDISNTRCEDDVVKRKRVADDPLQLNRSESQWARFWQPDKYT